MFQASVAQLAICMAFVYILQSEVNNRFYIGSTNNLNERLIEHTIGESKYTRNLRPFKLVFSQEYNTLEEARKIEYKLKSFKSKKIIERIINDKIIKIKV